MIQKILQNKEKKHLVFQEWAEKALTMKMRSIVAQYFRQQIGYRRVLSAQIKLLLNMLSC